MEPFPLSVVQFAQAAATDPLAGYGLGSYGLIGLLVALLIYGVRWVIRMLMSDRDAWRRAFEVASDTAQRQEKRDETFMHLFEELKRASESPRDRLDR